MRDSAGKAKEHISDVLLWTPAFWLGRLLFVPDGKSINDRFEAERPQLRLGHLRVGELLFVLLLCTPCIALDLTVQFKLYSSIRAQIRFRSVILLDSLDPHCTQWVNDQQGSSLGSFPTFHSLYPTLIGLRGF